MCMEDVRLGRSAVMTTVGGTARLAGGILIPQDRHRVGLVIGAPPTNRITLSWGGPTALDAGVTLYPGGAPLVLDVDGPHGSTIGPIYAFSAVADQAIWYAESTLSEE